MRANDEYLYSLDMGMNLGDQGKDVSVLKLLTLSIKLGVSACGAFYTTQLEKEEIYPLKSSMLLLSLSYIYNFVI